MRFKEFEPRYKWEANTEHGTWYIILSPGLKYNVWMGTVYPVGLVILPQQDSVEAAKKLVLKEHKRIFFPKVSKKSLPGEFDKNWTDLKNVQPYGVWHVFEVAATKPIYVLRLFIEKSIDLYGVFRTVDGAKSKAKEYDILKQKEFVESLINIKKKLEG